jgi:hypothetical protein
MVGMSGNSGERDLPMMARPEPAVGATDLLRARTRLVIQLDNKEIGEADAVCKQLKRNDIDCMTIRN